MKYDADGNALSFTLPDYTGQEFGEMEWGEFDWDDLMDDYGDEEEDSYGEDAA